MIKLLHNYINFTDIYADLSDAYKEIGMDIFSEEIPESIRKNLTQFFENKEIELDIEECEINNDVVTLQKGISGIAANESDNQGSFYYYWIQYCFDSEKIIDGDYEQG